MFGFQGPSMSTGAVKKTTWGETPAPGPGREEITTSGSGGISAPGGPWRLWTPSSMLISRRGPRPPLEAPKRPPRGPKDAPRGPTTAPKKLQNCFQDAPERPTTRSQRRLKRPLTHCPGTVAGGAEAQ